MADERLHLALEAAMVGSWDYDLRTSRLAWDARCRALFGVGPDAAVSHEVFLSLVHPEDRARVDAEMRHAMTGLTPYHAEYRAVQAGGRIVWISARGNVHRDESGNPIGFMGVALDVTSTHAETYDRESLTREREEAVAVFDTLLQQAPVGIALWDENLRFIRVNRAVSELNGIRVEAHHGKTPAEIFPEGGADVMKILERVRDTGETVIQEVKSDQLRGVERFWRVKYYPVRARLRTVGIGAICDEITQQKSGERQLAVAHEGERLARTEAERLNRMKDEFLSTVSHELRTPLQSILGWARTMREGGLSTTDYNRGLEIIDRNAQAQARIIDDILDVSRIISGKLRVVRQPVELGRTVEFALDTIRPAAIAKSIALTSRVDPDLGSIMADEDRIKQVLWNLLSNAVKFTPTGGSVSVDVTRAADLIELRVSDTGQGVRSAFLPHVFERFRQQDGGTTRSQAGLGLGLAIVRHIVEMHGGIVHVESRGEGKGTTFVVRLPVLAPVTTEAVKIAPKERRAASERKTPVKPLDGLRVLLVDDEEDARELLALVLRRNGAHTESVSSVREALSHLETTSYDVLVSDIGMPGEDGYFLSRALVKSPRRPRALLALTAYARAEDRLSALAAGFDGHVSKPIEPSELVETIAQLLSSVPSTPSTPSAPGAPSASAST